MRHMVAFYESQDPGGALINVAAVNDPTIYVNGDDIRVPDDLPYVCGMGALFNDASAARAQIASPSLRAEIDQDIEPVVAGAKFGSEPAYISLPDKPRQLEGGEDINFLVNGDPAAAVDQYGILEFCDGPTSPVSGEIITLRATGAAALSAGTWVNTPLTFSQVLPNGRYQVVGFRARGANLVAARLFFKGSQYRPGVPAVNAIGDRDHPHARFGALGVWGEFSSQVPPTVDCLGITDTTQVFALDLLKV